MQHFSEFLDDIVKYNLASSKNLAGDMLENIFYKSCNGCGAKGGIIFPSTMWGLNIETCCNLHDIDWSLADNIDDLIAANEIFDNNLKKIIDAESNFIMKRLRRMRAAAYVNEVELGGTDVYALDRGFIISRL